VRRDTLDVTARSCRREPISRSSYQASQGGLIGKACVGNSRLKVV
jgi:hypothetical protein